MSSILLLRDGMPRLKLPVGADCRIGRSSECDLQLLDHQLSRVHARIQRREDAYWLEDLGSRNGTFLAGERVNEPVRLAPGDGVSLGGLAVIFDPPLELLHERGGDKTLLLVPDEGAAEPLGLVQPGAPVDAGEVGLELEPQALLAVHRLTCDLAAVTDMEPLATLLMDRLLELFGADRGFVLLRSERSGRLTPAVIRTEREAVAISRSLVDHALAEQVPVLVSDAIGDVTFEGSKSVVAHQLRSVMLAPLLAGGEVLGLVQVDRRSRNAYDQSSLAQFSLLARAAAVALANARRFAQAAQRLREARAAGVALQPVPTPGPGGGEQSAHVVTGFISNHPSIERLLETTRKAAVAGSRVLISGESGTGKELIARRVHEQSDRASGPWVAINCAAVPETMIESELFGHEKGAFTGAARRKRGCFELADEGTLFLDEVGELPLQLQVKLLRAIQESTFYRVGGERPVQVDVRIVAATNQQLPQQVQQGRFRQDLYYRLAVLTVELPPLRHRPGDVALLMERFLDRFARALGKPVPALSPVALEGLERYRWPGNVRELKNVAERLVVLSEGATIEGVDLPAEISLGGGSGRPVVRGKLREVLAETERALVARALEEAGGKKVEACRILGISRPTLDKKIADYNLEL